MIKNNEKFSKSKLLIGIVGVVLFVILLLCFCTGKVISTPPELYATIDNNKYVPCIRGGYTWNSMFNSVCSDTLPASHFNYTNQNTIYVKAGEYIKFSNVKNKYNFGGQRFSLSYIEYYNESNRELVSDETVKMEINKDIIQVPDKPGTYILSVLANYYHLGKVNYGIKVVVGHDVEKFEEYKNTYIGDNSKVGAILNMLEYSKYLDKIELHTANEPYGLTVKYSGLDIDKNKLEFNSIVLFGLIDNLGYINYDIQVEDMQYKITVQRNEYDNTYEDVIQYIENISLIEEFKEIYLPIYAKLYSYMDLETIHNEINVSKDSLIPESVIWGYCMVNSNAIQYNGEYPRQLIYTGYNELTGNQLDNKVNKLGVYEYEKEKDCFIVAADYDMPLITKMKKFNKVDNMYAIEYEYCYPSDSAIFNLPMIETGENEYSISKEVYQQYIDNLQKFVAKIKVIPNVNYKYFKWQMVDNSFEKF